MDEVVLVNTKNEPIGTLEKMAAHRQPKLHRAFSVFLFNDQQGLLLQQRAHGKYHSAGLWTNTCCSHPRPGEETKAAAGRRLKEELGIEANIHWAFDFIYEASFDNGLYEYEYDHVYLGIYNGDVAPDPCEVGAYCYKSLEEINEEIEQFPERYTAWFKIALPKLESYFATHPLNKHQ